MHIGENKIWLMGKKDEISDNAPMVNL